MKSIVPDTLPTPRHAHFAQLCHNLLYLCLLVGCLHLNLLKNKHRFGQNPGTHIYKYAIPYINFLTS